MLGNHHSAEEWILRLQAHKPRLPRSKVETVYLVLVALHGDDLKMLQKALKHWDKQVKH